ncbi:MAG TPA: UPF0175 family protein [Pyrinomonadaceae bacterium]|nr:UPF0175 family protein [Pyrinomonadaceae bacterium]
MDVQVTIKLPDNLSEFDSSAVSRDVFEQVVAEGYRTGRLGPAQVRKLLGFSSRFETEDFLHRTKAMVYTVEDFEHDLETMARLGLR